MKNRMKAFSNLVVLTILGIFLYGTSAYSQEVDTMEFNGEQYFVYPFKVEVDSHQEYFDLKDNKYMAKQKKKSLKNNIENDILTEEQEIEIMLRSMEYEFYGEYKKPKINRKYRKVARANPYPLLQQSYRMTYDLIPSLDPIPDGKYIQLFEDFCLVDEKGRCQEHVDRVAGVFNLKNNTLEGEAYWLDIKGDTLKSGNFNGGLKHGVWKLEQRDIGYSFSEYDEDSYILDGHPFIDTSVMYQEYKEGVASGSYKLFERSEFPIEEGSFFENEEVGEWTYRQVLYEKQGDNKYKTRNRVNSKVTSRHTFADVSDSVIVKHPLIRDGLIRHYSAPDDVFDFYPKYRLDRMQERLFIMAFPAVINLELDEEQFGSYGSGGYDYDEYYYYDSYKFSDYQATIYDPNRKETLKRGQVIDSIGMISKYDGVMEKYYPNGQLNYRFVFENGQLLGEDTIFWDNGQAHDVINFLPDSNHYVRTIYDYVGTKFKEIAYDSLGDFKRIQYYYDDDKFVYLDGFKASDEKSSDYYFYNETDTLYHVLTDPLDIFRSWYKEDSSLIQKSHFNPITREYTIERYDVIGNTQMRSEKTFAEDFESWTGKSSERYSDLELVSTQSATYSPYWQEIDTFSQDNVKYAYRRFSVASENVLFKNGIEYTGEVELNFGKGKMKVGKNELTVDFPEHPIGDKKQEKLAEKIKKSILKYREKGKGGDDILLNYINASESDVNYGSKVYSDIFGDILNGEFSYPKSSFYGPYRDVQLKSSKIPSPTKVVGYMLDGRPHGLWVGYDQFDNAYAEVPFNKGEIDGQVKYYHYAFPELVQETYSYRRSAFEDTFPEKRTYYMSSSVDYKNGMVDGQKTYYDWMGEITSQEDYKDDLRDGVAIERNQLAYSKSNYKNGMLDGYVQTYLVLPDRDSILLYDLNFQEGSLQGESKSYHTNGNISKRGFFLNGDPIEDYEAFDSLGFRYHYVKFKYSYPIEEKIWEENELSVRYLFDWEDSIYFEPSDITTSQSLERMLIDLGFGGSYLNEPYYGRPSLVDKDYIKYHMTKYFPNDTVSRDGWLDDGKKIGHWKFFDYEGELLYMVDYQDSILNINDSIRFKSKGIYIEVDAAGDTLYTAHIIEKHEKYDCSHTDHYEIRQLYTIWQANDSLGRMNGYVRNYYDNGVLQNEGQMKDGLPVGPWKIYDPYGKLNQYGVYVSGKRDGRWLSGDLSKTKYLGDICLNPNLPDLESEIKYRENLLDIMITNYKLGRALNKQFYDVDMNQFRDFDEEEAELEEEH